MLNVNNYFNIKTSHKYIIAGKLKTSNVSTNCDNLNIPERYSTNLQIYPKPFILTFSSNTQINKNLSTKIDEAFSTEDASEFIRYTNRHLPTIKNIPPVITEENKENKDFPVSLIQINNKKPSLNNKISVDKHGHIQIAENGEKLFITKEELIKSGTMDEEAAHIIGNGIRGFDPGNQDDWVKTKLGKTWPTSPDTRDLNGVARPFVDKKNKAILFTSPNTVGENYGVNPRGIAAINPDSSVIIAYQQTNNNSEIDFSAWSIAPFKVPEGKKAIAIFPNNNEENLSDINNNLKWSIKDDLILLNPSKDGDMAGFISKKADWAIFAVEGSDKAYLMRSIYNGKDSNQDKFKAFCLGGENSNYLELEFMSPRVKQNEKSTIAYKIEPVFLSNYGLTEFSAEKIEDESIDLANKIKQKIQK